MHAVVAAGGELPATGRDTRRDLLGAADLVIAADSGLVACVEAEVWPHVVIGDFDSVDRSLVAAAAERGAEVISYPADKDATDLELGMALAAERGAGDITVLCPFGERIDHELSNVALLASNRWSDCNVSGHDGVRSLWVIRQARTLAVDVGAVVTLLPWGGDAHGVTTRGLRWQLDHETLALGSTHGVSNVVDAPSPAVAVDAGVLLAVVDQRA